MVTPPCTVCTKEITFSYKKLTSASLWLTPSTPSWLFSRIRSSRRFQASPLMLKWNGGKRNQCEPDCGPNAQRLGPWKRPSPANVCMKEITLSYKKLTSASLWLTPLAPSWPFPRPQTLGVWTAIRFALILFSTVSFEHKWACLKLAWWPYLGKEPGWCQRS